MTMSRFLILRRFRGVLQGTNRMFMLVCDHETCGAKEYNLLVRFHELGYAWNGGRPPPLLQNQLREAPRRKASSTDRLSWLKLNT